MNHRTLWSQRFGGVLLLGLLGAAVCSGCSSSQQAGDKSPEAAAAEATGSQDVVKVDLEAIFPPGAGRDLALENCQNCHTFVPIVVLQMDKDAWQRNSLDHRERVTTLTDEQFRVLYDYLSSNFGPHRPVPQLPKELLKTWTGY